jgi:hypothetical protein
MVTMDEIRYFGLFDKDGWPVGFFPSDIWPEPPKGAVEITEDQWRELLLTNRKFVDGKVIEAQDTRLAPS